MDEATLRGLLEDVRAGTKSADEVVAELRRLPFADLGFARVDHHRALRQGMPEAVYGPGKTPEQCVAIVGELLAHGDGPVLVTRTDEAQVAALLDTFPEGLRVGRTLVWRPVPSPAPDDPPTAPIVVVTAGTADLPVADECAAVLGAYGRSVTRLTDVGVAGVHRLLGHVALLQQADAVVVVAGMEGALASVVGGLTAAPVVAVPTSAGYGAGLEGVTALLGMLASCAAGLTVVGIDNGYGAACAVLRLLNRAGTAAADPRSTRTARPGPPPQD